MSVNDVFVFSDVTGTDVANFNLSGGVYGTTIVLAGGSVTLNVLAADETTWVPFQTWSSSAGATLTLVAGQYQFSWNVGATQATFGIAQQPPTPTWRLQSLTQPLPISSSGGITTVAPLGTDTELDLLGGSSGAFLFTPDSSGNTGNIALETGNSSGGNSGSITLFCGTADGTRGTLTLDAPAFHAPSGFSLDTSNANSVVLTAGNTEADNGDGGAVFLTSGDGAGSGNGGSITITLGTGVAQGNFIFANLPTSSSGLPSGAIWNNSGTLKIV